MSNKTIHSSARPKRRKSIHYQILLYTLSFLFGSLGSIIFYHTHVTKEIIRRIHQKSGRARIRIRDRTVCAKAFVDTGNSLCDPVTGRAVHLVRYQLLKPCLDPEAGRIIEQFYGNISGMKKIRREQADISGIGFRIIPYHAIGTEKGVLLGITADKLAFSDQGRKYIEEGCVIVPYPGDPFGEQGYEVILHPDILRK